MTIARIDRSRAARAARRAAVPPALAAALLLALALVGCDAQRPPPRRAGPPNLVIVLSDALRASNLRTYGYPRRTAPHLSALAEESRVFELHHANYPGTPPSVSQLHTGRFMSPILMGSGFSVAPVRALDEELFVLPRELGAAGYRTGLVSSHIWWDATARLLDHYDEHTVVEPTDGHPYAAFEDLMPAVERFVSDAHEDPRPFFLYLHSMDTHAPNRVHPGFETFAGDSEWPASYNRYDSEILYTDHYVGEVMEILRRQGVWENTVFVFVSDHGEELGELGPEYWNRDHGHTLRRPQAHIPLLIRIPDDPRAGERFEGLTRQIDLAPTLMHLLLPDFDLGPFRIDGEDLGPELAAPPDAAPSPRHALTYTWRWWALYEPDVELHWDQWKDAARLYGVERNAQNYQRVVPLDAPGRRAALASELKEAWRERTREFRELPQSTRMLRRTHIAVPARVHRDEGGAPTYALRPEDDRWTLKVNGFLAASPAEEPAPVAVSTPWSEGRYRLRVRLLPGPVRQHGYENRVTLEVAGAGNEPVRLDGADADAEGYVDAGVHSVGRRLTLRWSDPEGGVAVSGIALEMQGEGPEAVELEEGVEERLRALGYVE